MGQMQGMWVPETDAEADLLEAVHRETAGAYQDGDVPATEIAACLSMLAAVIVTYDDADYDELPDHIEAEQAAMKRKDCPTCGGRIDDVLVQMGGTCEVRPCGCLADVDDMDGWVDVPGGDD